MFKNKLLPDDFIVLLSKVEEDVVVIPFAFTDTASGKNSTDVLTEKSLEGQVGKKDKEDKKNKRKNKNSSKNFT